MRLLNLMLFFVSLIASLQGFANSSLVAIHMRSFAPYEQFGGGFEGDDRSFSTDQNASSRIHTMVKFDFKNNQVISVDSTSSGTTHLPTGATARAKPIAKINKNCDVDICISHEGGNPVTGDLAGGLGSYFTPDIDLHANLEFKEDGRYLEVSVEALGDAFPNAEIFLEDSSGLRVMLLKFHTQAGPNDGPVSHLPGDNRRPMGSLVCKVGLNSAGNFDSTISCID